MQAVWRAVRNDNWLKVVISIQVKGLVGETISRCVLDTARP